MTAYRGWQFDKNSVPVEISNATKLFIDRYGVPPEILEYSDLLASMEVELPEGLKVVTHAVHIPKNVILLGRTEE